jgi:DNA-binding response OmpR family regulator
LDIATDPLHTNVRILIATPDRDTREMYRYFLEQAGYDVHLAADGHGAIATALARLPSLVITDTWLPQLDGFALCSHLRQHPSTAGVPVVVLTSDAWSATIERAYRAGADVVLVKPVLPAELLEHARRVLRPARTIDGSSSADSRGDALQPPSAHACWDCGLALDHVHSYLRISDDHCEQRDHYICRRCGRQYHYGYGARKLREAG